MLCAGDDALGRLPVGELGCEFVGGGRAAAAAGRGLGVDVLLLVIAPTQGLASVGAG